MVRRDGGRSSHHRGVHTGSSTLGAEDTPGTTACCHMGRSIRMIPYLMIPYHPFHGRKSELYFELAHPQCQEEGCAHRRTCTLRCGAMWQRLPGWLQEVVKSAHQGAKMYIWMASQNSWFMSHSFCTMTVNRAINHICTMNWADFLC